MPRKLQAGATLAVLSVCVLLLVVINGPAWLPSAIPADGYVGKTAAASGGPNDATTLPAGEPGGVTSLAAASAAKLPTPVPTLTAGEDVGGAPPVGEQMYTVAEGDTLWDIATRFGVDFEALLERNPLVDYDAISPGDEIVVPPPGTHATGTTARGGERVDNPGGRIWMPFRTQMDGSPSAGSNCGPATLGMAMSYFGEWWTTAGIRRSVNEYQGTWDNDAGSSWEALAYAARKRGFRVVGVVDEAGNYRRWTVDDLVEQTKAGRPVILMVRYWSLPGHGDSSWWGDHYIAFLGLTASGDVVYHDAAFPDEASGAYRIMSQEQLDRAWSRTWSGQQYTAMALDWPG